MAIIKPFKGIRPPKDFYIGFKATVIMDYDSMNPVSILIHSGAPK